jgi:hypothetical protein
MKNHRRNIKRLAKRLNITLDEAIKKFYQDQVINKHHIYSVNKKRNKGVNGGLTKDEISKNRLTRKYNQIKFKEISKKMGLS